MKYHAYLNQIRNRATAVVDILNLGQRVIGGEIKLHQIYKCSRRRAEINAPMLQNTGLSQKMRPGNRNNREFGAVLDGSARHQRPHAAPLHQGEKRRDVVDFKKYFRRDLLLREMLVQ